MLFFCYFVFAICSPAPKKKKRKLASVSMAFSESLLCALCCDDQYRCLNSL